MFRFLLWIAPVLVLSSPASAQLQAKTFEELFQSLGNTITDAAAKDQIQLALSRIQMAVCEGSRPCNPATPEEIAQPPISVIDGRAAMVFGIQSAFAQWCGLDSRRGFLPMIVFGKGKMKMSDRQVHLMTLIHGDFRSRQLKLYQDRGQCPATLREQLDTLLPKM